RAFATRAARRRGACRARFPPERGRGSSKAPVAFFMYPQAENAQGRLDSLDPDNFKYRMTAREIS
ncbi:MAG: hypothetical protein ABI580_02510, partial [Burkholderiaceae bacterium]